MEFRRLCVLVVVSIGASAQGREVEHRHIDGNPSKCFATQSQGGEEELVIKAFGWEHRSGGTYVEIGALDGKLFSNTLALATCKDWGGVLIEASKVNYDRLLFNVEEQQRPRLDAYWGAVCAPPHRSIHFFEGGGAVGGDADAAGKSFIKQWHEGQATTEIPCKPMSHYLEGISHVDFFSLDVEGAELIVLETIDFTEVYIDVILVELGHHQEDKNWKIRMLLSNLAFEECSMVRVLRSTIFVRISSGLHCPGQRIVGAPV